MAAQACTGIEDAVEVQALKRSIMAFRFTNLL